MKVLRKATVIDLVDQFPRSYQRLLCRVEAIEAHQAHVKLLAGNQIVQLLGNWI
jgi:hypothetical protein